MTLYQLFQDILSECIIIYSDCAKMTPSVDTAVSCEYWINVVGVLTEGESISKAYTGHTYHDTLLELCSSQNQESEKSYSFWYCVEPTIYRNGWRTSLKRCTSVCLSLSTERQPSARKTTRVLARSAPQLLYRNSTINVISSAGKEEDKYTTYTL